MKTPEDNIDNTLDELLASLPLKPGANLADKTLSRLAEDNLKQPHSSTSLDDTIDALLAQQPLTPADNFADKVLERLAEDTDKHSHKKIVPFPAWVYTITAIAACVILALVISGQFNNQPSMDSAVASSPPDPEDNTSATAQASSHAEMRIQEKEQAIKNTVMKAIHEAETYIALNETDILQLDSETFNELETIIEMNTALDEFSQTVELLNNTDILDTWALLMNE